MTEADRWRICPHPSLVPHALPETMTVARTAEYPHLKTIPTKTMLRRPTLRRCTLCGQVGELAKPNV